MDGESFLNKLGIGGLREYRRKSLGLGFLCFKNGGCFRGLWDFKEKI